MISSTDYRRRFAASYFFNMLDRRKFMRRLLVIVGGLNLLGIFCFCVTSNVRDPLASPGFDGAVDPSSPLSSIGFTLMLPGIFFASIAFLCARVFAWSEQSAFFVWYATGFAINITTAWKVGGAFAPRRREIAGNAVEEQL